jgi:hypothetical protein
MVSPDERLKTLANFLSSTSHFQKANPKFSEFKSQQ